MKRIAKMLLLIVLVLTAVFSAGCAQESTGLDAIARDDDAEAYSRAVLARESESQERGVAKRA